MSTESVSVLTPAGSGAIAVIAIRGPNAWTIVSNFFRPASGRPLPARPVAGSTWFGRIGPGAGDEVIVAITAREPMSIVEVHCHGGPQVIRMLLHLFAQVGCEVLPGGARSTIDRTGAGLHGRHATRAWELLPHATTFRTASILLDQAQGAFDRAIAEVESKIQVKDLAEARSALAVLSSRAPIGQHLVEPWRIVIIGAPNAGKSNLLNALAGFQRSVVTPIAGTTRDVVSTTVAFDGWPVHVSDTAGLHAAGDSLEREGIDRARRAMADADLCLLVIDATVPADPTAGLVPSDRVLTVLNKIDLLPLHDRAAAAESIPISAKTGEGLDGLIQRIAERLVGQPPPPGAAVPFDEECLAAVEALRQAVLNG